MKRLTAPQIHDAHGLRDEVALAIRDTGFRQYFRATKSVEIPAKSDPADWAQRKRWIAQGASWTATDGDEKFDLGLTPYMREPLEATVDPRVQTVVLWWASDLGKTELEANVIGFCIDEEPSRIIVAYPIDKSAETWSKEVLQKLIDATPALRSKVHESKSRDPGNTISHKIFPGGSVSVIAAGSVSNFRLRRARVVIGDEIDAMPGSVGDEGDPIFLLFKRTEGYADSIQILSSTATIKNRSRIEWWFNKSDRRFYFVPCRKCGVTQTLKWSSVDFPKHARHRFERAVILCEACAAAHDDRQRLRMIYDGAWDKTAAFTGIAGFHLNGLYSTFPAKKGYRHKLHQFAQDAHDAKHSQNPKETVRVWVNTFLAETFQEEADRKPEWRKLFERREEYPAGKIPKGVILLEAGTDIQADRIEVEIVGFGRDEESWGIKTAILFGDPRAREIWSRLEGVLNTMFIREDGARLTVKGCGIDTGYPAAIRMAYDWIRPRQRRNFWAMKGSSLVEAEVIARARKSRVERVTLLMVGTNRIKDLIYDRALLETGGGVGFMHFPKSDDYNEEFFKQLLSENSYPEIKAGVRYRRFVHEADEDGVKQRNEALDRRVYAMAALYARGAVNWDLEEKANLKTIADADGKTEKTGKRRKRGSGDWFKW